MRRREVLKLGAGMAAGMALGGTGCALPGTRVVGDRLIPDDMGAFLGGWDAQLEGIGRSRFVEGFVSKSLGKDATPEMRRQLEPSESLFRGMLHTMFLTQTFRDLSEDAQFHPEVQKRMAGNLESVDATVSAVSGNLENMDAGRKLEMQRLLREQPGLIMEIAEALDGQAAGAGLTARRRTQLRSMLTQASFRLSKGDPGIVIDECVAKVRRASDPSRAEMLASQVSAQAGSDAFLKYRESLEAGGAGANAYSRPGQRALTAGGWMMGIGVITLGVSAIIVNAGVFGFVFGMTLGAVLMAIGLITVIVGAIIQGVKDPVD